MSRLRALPLGQIGVAALLLLLGVLIVLPVGVLVLGSFLSEAPRALHVDWSGLTLGNYRNVLLDTAFGPLLGSTMGAALAGTMGAAGIGAGLAWLAIRTDVPGRRALDVVAVMPLFVPPLIGAFAWDILASPRSGILNIVLRSTGAPFTLNIYSFAGIGFAYAIYYAPYVYLFVSAALRNMDATLEEAAAMSGAGRLLVLWHITLPLVAPALLASSLLVFVLLVELFAIPAVLGEPGNLHFIAVRIWDLIGFTPPKVNEASALGVLMLLMTVALVLIQHKVSSRRAVVTVSGKGQRVRPVTLGAARWPLAALGVGYLLLVVVLPTVALLFIALRRNIFFSSIGAILDTSQLSFEQFGVAFGDPVVVGTLWNSLTVSTATMLLGGGLYFIVSYIVHRTRLPGRRALDIVTVLPVAIPGIIIGLGYLWSWISVPVGLYGTLWIIILAYVSQFAPQATRAIAGSLVQIHPELEESSRLCGAGFLTTLRLIVAPLARPGIVSAMILLFVLSFRELATALFLYTTGTQLFSLAMFDFWQRGSTGLVAAMALVQCCILLVFVLLGQVFQGDRVTSSNLAATGR